MKSLRYIFLFVDIVFILYWLITAYELIPAEYLYNDYKNEILVNWNWSFLPLDLLVSATGFYSIYLFDKGEENWKNIALLSLAFTSASGLQAISYWTLAGDFELSWWIPNLFLLIYPVFYIPGLLKKEEKHPTHASQPI